MAKGQKRGNREIKKPKAKKPSAHEAAQSALRKGLPEPPTIGKQKKH